MGVSCLDAEARVCHVTEKLLATDTAQQPAPELPAA